MPTRSFCVSTPGSSGPGQSGWGADFTGDSRCRLRAQPLHYLPQELPDGENEYEEQAAVDAGIDGRDGLWRHGAAAEVGLADVVVRAKQKGERADAEQVDGAINDVVVATDGTEEQRKLRDELNAVEGNDDPVEGVPDSGQVHVEQSPGDIGTEHQYGEAGEREQPGEEDGAGDDVGVRRTGAVA